VTEPPRSQRQTIADYAASLASGEPTPGGGSAAAVVGALGAALAEMVCNLTLGRSTEPTETESLVTARDDATRYRIRLLELAQDDEDAYGAYRQAVGLPRVTPHERETRRAALEVALNQSASVPLIVAETVARLLAVLEPIARLGTRHARSDIATSAHLAHAAMQGAATLVRANASAMRNDDRARHLQSRIAAVERSGEDAYRVVLQLLEGQP
jgi:methenyltetrahydrofolate cyclohydrolase